MLLSDVDFDTLPGHSFAALSLRLRAFNGGKRGSIKRHCVLVGGLNGHSGHFTHEKSETQLKKRPGGCGRLPFGGRSRRRAATVGYRIESGLDGSAFRIANRCGFFGLG